jgi:hypothetical protein
MNHLIRNGHSNVRIAWRKNDSALKMATMYNGIPDALTGTSVYENIRISSKVSDSAITILLLLTDLLVGGTAAWV